MIENRWLNYITSKRKISQRNKPPISLYMTGIHLDLTKISSNDQLFKSKLSHGVQKTEMIKKKTIVSCLLTIRKRVTGHRRYFFHHQVEVRLKVKSQFVHSAMCISNYHLTGWKQFNNHKGSLSNCASNTKWIWVSSLTSIPSEIIRTTTDFLMISREA